MANFLQNFLNYYQKNEYHTTLTQRNNWIVSFTFRENDIFISKLLGLNNNKVFNEMKDNLSYYISDIDLKNILQVSEGKQNEIINEIGTYHGVGYGARIQPSQLQDLNITFFDTDISIVDTIFYPWIRRINKMDIRENDAYPHIRSNIYIDILSHDMNYISSQYIIVGAYPYLIELPILRYDNNAKLSTRKVTFKYNTIEVYLNEKLLNTKKSINYFDLDILKDKVLDLTKIDLGDLSKLKDQIQDPTKINLGDLMKLKDKIENPNKINLGDLTKLKDKIQKPSKINLGDLKKI